MTTLFNDWFPTSRYGNNALSVLNFGAYGDNVRSLGSVGFTSLSNAQNGIGGNGIAYPSATSLDDYVDWCAITECFKQAFQHETEPGSGVWEPNLTETRRNKPVFFPGGM